MKGVPLTSHERLSLRYVLIVATMVDDPVCFSVFRLDLKVMRKNPRKVAKNENLVINILAMNLWQSIVSFFCFEAQALRVK